MRQAREDELSYRWKQPEIYSEIEYPPIRELYLKMQNQQKSFFTIIVVLKKKWCAVRLTMSVIPIIEHLQGFLQSSSQTSKSNQGQNFLLMHNLFTIKGLPLVRSWAALDHEGVLLKSASNSWTILPGQSFAM